MPKSFHKYPGSNTQAWQLVPFEGKEGSRYDPHTTRVATVGPGQTLNLAYGVMLGFIPCHCLRLDMTLTTDRTQSSLCESLHMFCGLLFFGVFSHYVCLETFFKRHQEYPWNRNGPPDNSLISCVISWSRCAAKNIHPPLPPATLVRSRTWPIFISQNKTVTRGMGNTPHTMVVTQTSSRL